MFITPTTTLIFPVRHSRKMGRQRRKNRTHLKGPTKGETEVSHTLSSPSILVL